MSVQRFVCSHWDSWQDLWIVTTMQHDKKHPRFPPELTNRTTTHSSNRQSAYTPPEEEKTQSRRNACTGRCVAMRPLLAMMDDKERVLHPHSITSFNF